MPTAASVSAAGASPSAAGVASGCAPCATDTEALAFISAVAARSEKRTTRTVHGEIAWRGWGTAHAGPPLLLLHGGSGSWTHWIRNIESLAEHHCVWAADTPGLGDSSDPPAPYSADSLADALVAGLDALLPGTEFQIAGFSFGGILGGHVAARLGARVHRLVLIGAPPFGVGPGSSANEVSAVPRTLSLEQAADAHRRNLRLLLLAHDHSVDALALRVHHDNLVRARLRSRKIARTDVLARALEHTSCGLGGIWGDADVTIHPSLEATAGALTSPDPSARLDVLEGVGHWAMFESPARFNRCLLQQLNPQRRDPHT